MTPQGIPHHQPRTATPLSPPYCPPLFPEVSHPTSPPPPRPDPATLNHILHRKPLTFIRPLSTSHLSKILPLFWKQTEFLTLILGVVSAFGAASPLPLLAQEEEKSTVRWPGTASSPSVPIKDAWSLQGENLLPASLSVISSLPDLFFHLSTFPGAL